MCVFCILPLWCDSQRRCINGLTVVVLYYMACIVVMLCMVGQGTSHMWVYIGIGCQCKVSCRSLFVLVEMYVIQRHRCRPSRHYWSGGYSPLRTATYPFTCRCPEGAPRAQRRIARRDERDDYFHCHVLHFCYRLTCTYFGNVINVLCAL